MRIIATLLCTLVVFSFLAAPGMSEETDTTATAVITPDARLMEDIGIDSLGFYEILIEADTCFGIRIQEEQLLQFKTVGDIQSHLESLNLDASSSRTP